MGLRNIARALSRLRGTDISNGRNCPDEAELAAYVDARCEQSKRLTLQVHLSGCILCRKQVAFLVREDTAVSLPEVPDLLLSRARELVPERPPYAKPLWWATAAAAAACLIVAVALQVRVPTTMPVSSPAPAVPTAVQRAVPTSAAGSATGPPPAIRAATPRGGAPDLVQPAEGANVRGGEVEFRWRPLRECLFYELRVTSADGELLFSERTEDTRLRLPASISLRPGEKYFVWVAAHLREGKTVKARAIGFRVESPKE